MWFRRLFELSLNKSSSVATMSLGLGGWWRCVEVEEKIVGMGGGVGSRV